MTIEIDRVSYLPADLEPKIIAALTLAHQAIIRSYCELPEVGSVTVKAYYPGGFAAIIISANNGSSTQIKLEEASPLAKILYDRAMG